MALPETRLQLKARELEMRSDYVGAILLYEKEKSHRNPAVAATSLRGMAQCYQILGDFEQAEQAYEQLTQKSTDVSILCEYAEVLLRNGKYAEAKQKAKDAQKADVSYTEQAQRLITTCNNAERWTRRPTRVTVTNLGNINTCYSEWGVTVLSSKEMLFSSDRPMERPNCGRGRQQGNNFSRAFFAASAVEEATLTWELTKMLPSSINKSGAQVGPFSVSASDADLLYYTRTSKKRVASTITIGREKVRVETENLEIYATRRNGSEWGESVPFEHNNPQKYSVMHPCLSSDGQTLYFASDMPGGLGGMDLWYCEKQESNGRWGAPVNLGASVNTLGNEVFPTMGADGTLYFSSNGHSGMGGLDIFFAKKENGEWTTPKNMGVPINSSADDFSLVFDPFNANAFGRADTIGYFSSNRPGGQGGDDLYMFVLSGAKLLVPTLVVQADQTLVAEDDTGFAAATGSDSADVWVGFGGERGAAATTVDDNDATAAIDNDATATPVVDSAAATPVVDPAAATLSADSGAAAPAAWDEVTVAELPRITLRGKVVDKDTRQPLANAKICATNNATKTSDCKECGKDGTIIFSLLKDSRYTVSGFKEGYHSTDPIRILSTVFLQEEELEIEMISREPGDDFQSAQEVIDRAAMPVAKKRSLPREYRIQILTNWIETDWEYFTRLRSNYPQFELQSTKRNYSGTGMATRWTYGSFTKIGDARRYLRSFIRLGYTDAFIAVFEYGSQVESIYVSGSRHVIPN
ncbi:MAG: tetratricopeptide repeat protein [Prevotellaceae bacterium]|nr:tetratricopeptide repeat protein [Prevotellaceae bacterium]